MFAELAKAFPGAVGVSFAAVEVAFVELHQAAESMAVLDGELVRWVARKGFMQRFDVARREAVFRDELFARGLGGIADQDEPGAGTDRQELGFMVQETRERTIVLWRAARFAVAGF